MLVELKISSGRWYDTVCPIAARKTPFPCVLVIDPHPLRCARCVAREPLNAHFPSPAPVSMSATTGMRRLRLAGCDTIALTHACLAVVLWTTCAICETSIASCSSGPLPRRSVCVHQGILLVAHFQKSSSWCSLYICPRRFELNSLERLGSRIRCRPASPAARSSRVVPLGCGEIICIYGNNARVQRATGRRLLKVYPEEDSFLREHNRASW